MLQHTLGKRRTCYTREVINNSAGSSQPFHRSVPPTVSVQCITAGADVTWLICVYVWSAGALT
jgi:hypothetical protein